MLRPRFGSITEQKERGGHEAFTTGKLNEGRAQWHCGVRLVNIELLQGPAAVIEILKARKREAEGSAVS